tara:strand:+ start:4790 stop:5938 length:1149 start_codon:yes stop_codon:yes gene_type:complete
MTFALTKYIYPIEKGIVLSDSLNYIIDNPRTEKEIEIILDILDISIVKEEDENDSSMAPIGMRYILSFDSFKKELEKVDKDCYALKYYAENSKKSIIEILAETWVILRFPEDQEFLKIANNNDELFNAVFNNKKSEYAQKFDKLANYCHVLSNLANNIDNYHGESFLLSDNAYDVFYKSKNKKTIKSINNLINRYNSFKRGTKRENWMFWTDAKEPIIENSKRLESLIVQEKIQEKGKKIRLSQKQSPLQKILHIGGLQKTAYEHLQDPELMLLLLVSIIEYLVTRNPDTNKFNVEDSISKQFKLKCTVLIHSQEKDYDLVKLSNDLNILYSQRSDIAHGNYKEDFDIEKIVEYVILLNNFIKHIINEFIEDRNLLEYLKDN